jgi:hypothetical protein
LPYSALAAIIFVLLEMIEIKEKIAKEAYQAGKEEGVRIGIEMGLAHTIEVLSAELHRYKFPEGHEKRWNYKIDQHRPDDNSMFEFKYQRYEDIVKEREANERRARKNRARSRARR